MIHLINQGIPKILMDNKTPRPVIVYRNDEDNVKFIVAIGNDRYTRNM